MAATGPHKNNYIISDLVLGDTFEEWFTVTNTKIIDKLNRLKVYTATGNEGVTANTNDAGQLTVGLETIIPSDHTFTGNITFNGDTTTINSFELNVDDYNLILGDTGPGGSTAGDNDQTIGTGDSVGGGIIIRGSSSDKSLLWKYPRNAFILSDHMGLSGTKGIGSVGNNLRIIDMHTGGVSAGIQFGFTASTGTTGANTTSGPTAGNRDLLVHYSTQNGTAGTTHEIARVNSDAFVEIVNGVNRKRITQTGHGFTFGTVLRRDFDTATDKYVTAKADTKQNAEVVGIVSRVVDANTFDLTFSGEIVANSKQSWGDALTAGLSDLSPGHAYFLSHTSAGKLSLTPVQTPGYIRKPVITALDENRALVTNYIGHEIADETVIAAAGASNRKIIEQVNDFEVGDVLRFNPDVKYGLSGGVQFTGITYEHGTYVKAQANSTTEAEAVGIVSQVDVNGDVKKFYMTTGGYFTMEESYGLTAGQVYFLSANSAGSTASKSLVTDSPKTVGMVRKPLLVTSSNTECFFVNYVGTTITETINADRLQALAGKTFSPMSYGRQQLTQQTNNAGSWPNDGTGYSHGIIALNGNTLTRPDIYDDIEGYSAWQAEDTDIVPSNATHALLTFEFNLNLNSTSEHRVYVEEYDSGIMLASGWKNSNNRIVHLRGSNDRRHAVAQVIVPINASTSGSHIMYAIERSTIDGPLTHNVHLEGFYIDDSEVLVPNPSGTYRNKIINGNFEIWQRERGIGSTGDTTNTNGYYTADRWTRSWSTGTPTNFSLQRGTFTLSQTDVPNYPKYYMRHSGHLAGATSASSYVALEQKIEGVRTLAGNDATVSFWAKGTKSGKIHVGVKQDFGSGGDNAEGGTELYGSVMGCEIGTGWSKFTGTVGITAFGATAAEGTGSNLSLQFYTYAPSGSGIGNQEHIEYDGVLELSQVQIEDGAKATPFDHHEEQIELERCQRYYWQDANLSLYVDGTDGTETSGNGLGTIFFPETMRAVPTMTVGYVTTAASATASTIGTRSSTITCTPSGIPGADTNVKGFKADAEL